MKNETGTLPKMPASPSEYEIPCRSIGHLRWRLPAQSLSSAARWFGVEAENIVASATITAAAKVNILLAFIRALNGLVADPIQRGDDVDWLALEDPCEFERMLRAFWLLCGGGAFGAGDALERAERGSQPTEAQLCDDSVRDAWPKAAASISSYVLRNKLRATGLLAVAVARGQAT